MTSQFVAAGKLLIVVSFACAGLYLYSASHPPQRPRTVSVRTITQNNLKQIGLAVANFEQLHGKLPDNIRDAEGNPLLSWRVAILPFLESEQLYEQFKLDEPWDSEHNKTLIALMPRLYRSPLANGPPGFTRYLGNAHPQGMLSLVAPEKALRSDEIEDGGANTIWALEVNDKLAVEWTRPADYASDMPPLDAFTDYARGIPTIFVDGYSRILPAPVTPSKLEALLTRNGGEKVDPN